VGLFSITGPFGSWGAVAPGERERALSCDEHLPQPDQVVVRAIEVDAGPEHVYRWLCQMRVAPYSYDWIDNLGRRSPRALTPGLEQLEAGQRIATVFRVAAFEPGRSITMVHDGPAFGTVACTYLVEPGREQRSRIFVRLLVRYRRNPLGALMALVLPAGDMVMMAKQLRTFRDLAAGRP
jgi:hypothetical protein